MDRVAIYGAGGLGSAVSEICLSEEEREFVGFIDDIKKEPVLDFSIIGKWRDMNSIVRSYGINSIVICLGDGFSSVRWRAFELLEKKQLTSIPLIHESAVISDYSSVGDGSIIMPLTVVGPNVKIGRNCVLYSSCNLEHDVFVGDNVFIAPGAKISGYVNIGDHSFIGANATVIPDMKIGINATIGAGTTVIRNVPDNTEVAGNPARILRTKSANEYY